MASIAVIVGSTRQGRFADAPASFVLSRLAQRKGIEPKLLDLRDYPMPFFDELASPARPDHPPYTNDAVLRWTAEIGKADGFVVVSPEYNHAYPAVLKNAFDYVYPEWVRKPISFVSYGNANGARAVEQLRLVAVELQMAPLKHAWHVPLPALMAHYTGGDVPAALAEAAAGADAMIDELVWWTDALARARAL